MSHQTKGDNQTSTHKSEPAMPPSTKTPVMPGINTCVQILLCACSSGVEMCATFTQIFVVLYLQFLDVPMNLISVHGVVSGISSLLVLPFLGWLSDKGSNPTGRKVMIVLLCLFIYLVSLSGILSCAILKIIRTDDTLQNQTNKNDTILGVGNSTDINFDFTNCGQGSGDKTLTRVVTQEPTDYGDNSQVDGILPSVYLAIFSFAMMDIGFDVTLAMSRAFILECVPRFQHTRLLLVASTIQSFSGLIFSFLSTFDITDSLASTFHVNGTAARIVVQMIFLAFVVTLTFSCSIVTGHFLIRKKRVYFDLKRKKRNLDDVKRPLIEKECVHSPQYLSISKTNSFDTVITRTKDFDKDSINISMSTDRANDYVDSQGNSTHVNNTIKYQPKECRPDSTTRDEIVDSISIRDGFLVSYSKSFSGVSSTFDQDLNHEMEESCKKSKGEVNQSTTYRKIIILCISTFLTIGSLECVMYYSATVLTIEIYHGIATALPGSEAFKNYQNGLTTAAWGALTLNATFAFISIINTKLLQVMEERLQFVFSHLMLISCFVAFLVVKTEELFFVSSAMAGLQRTCVYTLPYVLVNKFTQDQTGGSQSKTRGKVMSLIGFLVPLHYVIMSAIMGPLMDATENFWVPIIYATVVSISCTLVFILLFFVKN